MSKVNVSGGVGFWGLLTIVLITLKLTGTAQFSWWWCVFTIAAPLWIALSIMAISAALLFVLTMVGLLFDASKMIISAVEHKKKSQKET